MPDIRISQLDTSIQSPVGSADKQQALHTEAAHSDLDVTAHRDAREYCVRELVARILWALVRPIFFLSPRMIYEWRNFLLRRFGAQVGRGVRIYPTVRVFAPWNLSIEDHVTVGDHVNLYAVGKIRIGKRTMVSQNAHLCAGSHDYRTPELKLLRTPITVESDVWICSDAFIGPNVKVGHGAVVGARSAVFRDVVSESVVGGNPAKTIRMRLGKTIHPEPPRKAA